MENSTATKNPGGSNSVGVVSLALRNIGRQKARTAMTLGAILIGVVGLILTGGFVEDLFVQLGEAIIHSQTGHIQVYRHDFLSKGSRQPDKYIIENPETLARQISAIPEVQQITARLNFSGLLNNGKRDLAIIGEGIEPDKEAAIGSYLTISAGRVLTNRDDNGIMLGQGVADSLGLHPGDAVTLLMNTADGAVNTQEFVITGVFQSFSKDFDARAVRVHLHAAQQLFASSGSNLLVVMLRKTEDTARVMTKMSQVLQGSGTSASSWRQISDFYDKSVDMYQRQFGVLQGIILIMVLLSVANSVNMSTYERLGEFGTMRALGNRSSDVVNLLLVESIVLGLVGATAGTLLGIVAALAISAVGIPMPPPPNATVGYTALIRVAPLTVLTAFVVGVVATVLASILPAYRVSRVEVVDALRQNV
jgi:putative ABC transport system permease protein